MGRIVGYPFGTSTRTLDNDSSGSDDSINSEYSDSSSFETYNLQPLSENELNTAQSGPQPLHPSLTPEDKDNPYCSTFSEEDASALEYVHDGPAMVFSDVPASPDGPPLEKPDCVSPLDDNENRFLSEMPEFEEPKRGDDYRFESARGAEPEEPYDCESEIKLLEAPDEQPIQSRPQQLVPQEENRARGPYIIGSALMALTAMLLPLGCDSLGNSA